MNVSDWEAVCHILKLAEVRPSAALNFQYFTHLDGRYVGRNPGAFCYQI